jgi:hypothetical protein
MWKPWEVRREHVLMLILFQAHARAQIIARYRTYCPVFEKRQLWGVALKTNFGKQLSETNFGVSSLEDQLFGAAFDNNFGECLSGTALGGRSNFARQL